jgi:acetylornithine deacetylase/succinyl-diaminopimelate desuccinylase-like protein
VDPRDHGLTRAERGRLLADLGELVAVPSVSADPRRAPDCRRAARWLVRRLRAAGVRDVGLVETGGPPAVMARALPSARMGAGRCHVLVYGHYDVQPAGAGWTFPPFRLTTVRDRYAVGRGAADDKGPVLAHLHAVERLLARGRLPVGVSFLLDGEEEIGSPSLAPAVAAVARGPRPDVVVVSDTRMISAREPALVRSLRGSLPLEVTVRSAAAPMHSGAFGGAVAGAADDLVRALASLPRMTSREGDHTTRPALSVTCLSSRGRASAIPASASARLDLRTVRGQDAHRLADDVERRLRGGLPTGSSVRVRRGTSSPAVAADVTGPWADAAATALRDAFGRRPAVTTSGGTIAAVARLQSCLGVPVVLMGFTPPDARIHAPDERMDLQVLSRAVTAAEQFLQQAAEL